MKEYIRFLYKVLQIWFEELIIWIENKTGIAERKEREFFEGMKRIKL